MYFQNILRAILRYSWISSIIDAVAYLSKFIKWEYYMNFIKWEYYMNFSSIFRVCHYRASTQWNAFVSFIITSLIYPSSLILNIIYGYSPVNNSWRNNPGGFGALRCVRALYWRPWGYTVWLIWLRDSFTAPVDFTPRAPYWWNGFHKGGNH